MAEINAAWDRFDSLFDGDPGPSRATKEPVVIGYSAQGREVIRDHRGKVSEVFDSNDPEQWL